MRRQIIAQWLTQTQGSMTVEASMVYPVIFMLLCVLLLFSVSTFQAFDRDRSAALLAERQAYTFDNSGKNVINGAYENERGDGLYWRWMNDQLASVIGMANEDGDGRLKWRHGLWSTADDEAVKESIQLSLVTKKLMRSAAQSQDTSRTSGEIAYRRGLVIRSITASVELELPGYIGRNRIVRHYEQQAAMIEPVEFNRTVDLVRYYGQHINRAWAARKQSKAQVTANQSLADESVLALPPSFQNAKEATVYICKLIKGGPIDVTTSMGVRKLDAVDPDGIAHEVKFGYHANSKDGNREQLMKDGELLKSGLVKGMVWHFFKNDRTGRIGPSAPLLDALREQGIIAVVHEME